MVRKVPISEAARLLGISVDLARKQVQRGTLPAEKQGKRWLVLLDDAAGGEEPRVLDATRTAEGTVLERPGAVPDSPEPDRERPSPDPCGELTLLREFLTAREQEVDFLRGELTTRSEELRRKDHIIAALTDSLARRMPELPAPSAFYSPPEAPVAARPAPRPFWKFWQWFGVGDI